MYSKSKKGGLIMKSIRAKISLTLILCTLVSIVICGGISIINTSKKVSNDSSKQMQLTCQNESNDLDSTLKRISNSVDTLSNISLSYLTDVQKFKTNKAYVDSYTEKLKPLLQEFAENTDGVMSAYIRFNPDFTYPTSGLFLTRDDSKSEFKFTTPTDFSMYDKSDSAHVGWYYIPVEKKAPIWMAPYLNSNLGIYMTSYIVPIFINGESIGIIGMDIDFTLFSNIVDNASIFKSGYAFLTDSNEAIVYHKTLDIGTQIKDVSPSLHKSIQNIKNPNETLCYTYKGKTKYLYSTLLSNGMYFSMTATKAEIYHDAYKMALLIMSGSLVALIISVVIGLFFGQYIASPILKLKDIVVQTAQFDFTPSKYGTKLCNIKDETGQMARAIREMRNNLRRITSDIQDTQSTLTQSMIDLMGTSNQVAKMSEDNSATTEELSAAMEETAATMESIETTMQTIESESKQIKTNCDNGASLASEVKVRANQLKQDTKKGSEQTRQMYDNLLSKTQTALEKAKTVEQINQLANVILDISEQTNLLALNASIEAARAGEAGKGFHVVASEIGSLAAQTASTTETIKSTIVDIHSVVDNMTQCLKECTDFLNNNVLTDYDEFISTSEHYANDAQNYEEGMSSIKHSIESLSKAIQDISEAINGVNVTVEETSVGITDIASKAQDTTMAIENNNSLIQANDEQIKKLQGILAMFHMNE